MLLSFPKSWVPIIVRWRSFLIKAFLIFFLVFLTAENAFCEVSQLPPSLSSKIKQSDLQYFNLYSQREISEKDYETMRRYLTEVRRQVGDTLGIYPQKKIDVIFTDSQVFHSYTKTAQHVAGLFDGKIHIPVPSVVSDQTFLK